MIFVFLLFNYFNLLLNQNKINKNYNSKAYVSTINHSKIENRAAIQIFTKYGPIAFLPISKNQTSIVFSFRPSKGKIIKK